MKHIRNQSNMRYIVSSTLNTLHHELIKGQLVAEDVGYPTTNYKLT